MSLSLARKRVAEALFGADAALKLTLGRDATVQIVPDALDATVRTGAKPFAAPPRNVRLHLTLVYDGPGPDAFGGLEGAYNWRLLCMASDVWALDAAVDALTERARTAGWTANAAPEAYAGVYHVIEIAVQPGVPA